MNKEFNPYEIANQMVYSGLISLAQAYEVYKLDKEEASKLISKY